MRIAIEGQRLFRTKKHGMDMVALELVRNLMLLDTENEYFVFVAPGEDKCLSDTKNFKIIELKGKTYPFWEQVALPRAVKRYNCQVLHCTSNTAPLNVNVPLVLTLHDVIFMQRNNLAQKQATLYQRLGNLYRRLIVPHVYAKSAKVITVSEFERSVINRQFKQEGDASNLSYIYNGVSNHFKEINDSKTLKSVRKKYNLPDTFIFHLGNTDPKKNTLGVISAFAEFVENTGSKETLLILDFNLKMLQKHLKEINKPELAKQIVVAGYIANSDLPAIYSMSKFFLYPSLRESFGIPILEAMKCGTPVITSNTSSMPEIAGGAALLANPFDTKEITQQMIAFELSVALRKKFSEAGLKQAEKFSWRTMAMQVLEIYNQLSDKVRVANAA